MFVIQKITSRALCLFFLCIVLPCLALLTLGSMSPKRLSQMDKASIKAR